MTTPQDVPLGLVGPSYNIYRYTDHIYKVIHFPRPRLMLKAEKAQKQSSGKKLDASFSRAKRIILELALCNPWKWFCTFTLDPNKFDRYHLDVWYKSFTQWIRDQRKKFGVQIDYILIPELHKDGAWHMHGMFSDVPGLTSFSDLRTQGWKIPDYLVTNNFYCWPAYHQKYGYCSFGSIKSAVGAGFYVTKYMEKSFSDTELPVGAHLYYASHGLNRAVKHGEIYGECEYLNQFTVNKYEFCETGMTHLTDNLDWDFALEYMAVLPLQNNDTALLDQLNREYFDLDSFEQIYLEGFGYNEQK